MNLNDTLSRFLFIHARNTEPDGRPLYAYKCRKKDYDRFETAMQEMLPAALRGSHHVEFSALFCLYAAESWRRKHSGGVWKWETVFSDVCLQVPAHTHIVRWVREGLCHWSFDEGLMSVGDDYDVLVSGRVRTEHNMPGHILTLTGRPIFRPDPEKVWPGRENLARHRKEVFVR